MEKYKHLGINVDKKDPEYINDFSKALLDGFYVRSGETVPEALARAATAFCYGDYELAQRIYDYAYKGWFMFASPILSNAPKGSWVKKKTSSDWKTHKWEGESNNSMPISCFALYIDDTLKGQFEANTELSALSVAGGGVGLHNGIRASSDKASGVIPYAKTMDALIGYYKQGKVRRGACAMYMDVNHPDIIEHIKFRIPTGGDSARKADNRKQYHNAVNITQDFIDKVNKDQMFDLVCPHSGEVRDTVRARDLWETILETRVLTGEPYLFKIDTANTTLPLEQKSKGLEIKGSNICIEICLPTNKDRSFVCCLSSTNIAKYHEWKHTGMVKDLVRFLDNVLEYYIENAPDELFRSVYSAKMERAIGIGAMGLHTLYQQEGLPFDSKLAAQLNKEIFENLKSSALEGTLELGKERGEPSDMVGSGKRNSNLLAVAPNSNNSIILGVSASIEPINTNAYSHSTRAGTFLVKNKNLEKVLRKHNNEDVWIENIFASINKQKGSVQHLDFLTQEEKNLFKTAVEIDQNVLVDQADDRAKEICQSQSLNLFFPKGVDEGYMNRVHLNAMNKKYLKSLYYCRMNREVSSDTVKDIQRNALKDFESDSECTACHA
ncbi:ribonucleotide reductase barrel domain [Vibrio phage 1.084.O._10N.261.49.F5]|nr:ribonucleotide reductase barrel domain [Vibrio phage 1.084.O._10N.261.49.F5]